MGKCLQVLLFLLLLTALTVPLAGQDIGVPDTLYFGDHGKAYGVAGDIFRIPVYINSDHKLWAVSFGLEFGIEGLPLHYDSTSTFGSIFSGTPYFAHYGLLKTTVNVNHTMPDTIGYGGVALADSEAVPPGTYKFCDVWISGAAVGQQIVVDTSYFRPAGAVLFDVGGGNPSFTPQCVVGTLTIVPASPEVFFTVDPSPVVGDAGSDIVFDVEVFTPQSPQVVVLDSVINVVTGSEAYPLPATAGTNPITVTWKPRYDQYGDWFVHFTVTDPMRFVYHIQVLVKVNYVEAPCDALRGDPNCDNQIDVADVVYIISYIFMGGPRPGCQPEK